MTIKESLHKFIDTCWEDFMKMNELSDIAGDVAPLLSATKPYADTEEDTVTEELDNIDVVPTTPGMRAVRTPLSGDKVYLLNEEDMTKKWCRTPDMLKENGFSFGDVQKIEDTELAKYKLSL